MIVLEQSALEDGWLFGQPSEDILLMLLFFDKVLDFLILFVEMAAFLGLCLVVLPQDLVF